MGKKFCLSANDKKIAGVCGGIAEYFGIDTTVIDRNNTEEYTTVMLEATSKAVFIDELNSTINTQVYPQTTVEVETFTDKVNDEEYTTEKLEYYADAFDQMLNALHEYEMNKYALLEKKLGIIVYPKEIYNGKITEPSI